MQWSARLVVLGLLALGCHSEPLEVARVDLSRMQGKWFEIAKLPRPSEAGCSGTTAEYQLYLWILSREPALPKSTLDGVLSRAKAHGFPVGILSFTEQ